MRSSGNSRSGIRSKHQTRCGSLQKKSLCVEVHFSIFNKGSTVLKHAVEIFGVEVAICVFIEKIKLEDSDFVTVLPSKWDIDLCFNNTKTTRTITVIVSVNN